MTDRYIDVHLIYPHKGERSQYLTVQFDIEDDIIVGGSTGIRPGVVAPKGWPVGKLNPPEGWDKNDKLLGPGYEDFGESIAYAINEGMALNGLYDEYDDSDPDAYVTWSLAPKDVLKLYDYGVFRRDDADTGMIEIGRVGVDAGMLIVGDPCFIKDTNLARGREGWTDFLKEIAGGKDIMDTHGTFMGRIIREDGSLAHQYRAGVCFSTGLGDGEYSVMAEIRDVEGWGRRVCRIVIDFIGD
jgi:hypothetical protein